MTKPKDTTARMALVFACGNVEVDRYLVTLGDDGMSGSGAMNIATFYVEFSQMIERFVLANDIVKCLVKAAGGHG